MKGRVLILSLLLSGAIQVAALAQTSLKPEAENAQQVKLHMTEEDKISHLINYVRHLEGSTFIRNGKEFNPDKAADHLQSKYDKHKKKVKTAHDFVDRLASFSKTKEPYKIRLSNGETILCGDLLNRELKRIEG